MKEEGNHTEQEHAKNFLERLVTARNLPLLVLGMTTIAIVFPTALDWTEETFGAGTLATITANIFTMIIYGAVDGVLELTLKYIDGAEPKKGTRGFFYGIVFVACVTLGASGTFSIWSNGIIIALLDGGNDNSSATKELVAQKLQNDRAALESSTVALENAIKTEGQRIKDARNEAAALEREAARTSHSSWYRDYQDAKNNPSHWFWICKSGVSGCPPNYVAYREKILSAREEGRQLIASEKALVSALQNSNSDDPTGVILTQLVKMDSVDQASVLALRATKQKALVTVELISLMMVVLLTLVIFVGKRQHKVQLDGSFITLFGAIEMGVMKIVNIALGLYTDLLDSINPKSVQNAIIVPIVAIGDRIGGKLNQTRQQLQEERAQREALEAEREKMKQEQAEAQRRAAEEVARLERERAALERAKEEERRAREREEMRAEREKMRLETLERARIEDERMRKEEATARREAELKRQEEERRAREAAQNKAREQKTLKAIDKKDKDRILNAIRYKWKRYNESTDKAERGSYRAEVEALLKDKKQGLAFLESRGYECSFDWKTGKISAKFITP